MNHSALERPDTNNYFRFYGLEERFDIDLNELKTRYLDKSKQYHPDFFGDDPQSQNIAVATSSFNNIAYKTLNNAIKRAQYLTELKLHNEDDSIKLSQEFLMEMMELNEAIDDMQPSNKSALELQIETLKTSVSNEIFQSATDQKWLETQMGILKWKYLERLSSRF